MSFGKCSVCDSDVLYNVESREMKCEMCGKVEESHIWCESGHYICADCCAKDVMKKIKEEIYGIKLTNPVDIGDYLIATCGMSCVKALMTFIFSIELSQRSLSPRW